MYITRRTQDSGRGVLTLIVVVILAMSMPATVSHAQSGDRHSSGDTGAAVVQQLAEDRPGFNPCTQSGFTTLPDNCADAHDVLKRKLMIQHGLISPDSAPAPALSDQRGGR